jgi:hypothetical protein
VPVPVRYQVSLDASVPATMSIVNYHPSGSSNSSSYLITGSSTGSITAAVGDYLIFSSYNSSSAWPLYGTSTMTLSTTGSFNI